MVIADVKIRNTRIRSCVIRTFADKDEGRNRAGVSISDDIFRRPDAKFLQTIVLFGATMHYINLTKDLLKIQPNVETAASSVSHFVSTIEGGGSKEEALETKSDIWRNAFTLLYVLSNCIFNIERQCYQ